LHDPEKATACRPWWGGAAQWDRSEEYADATTCRGHRAADAGMRVAKKPRREPGLQVHGDSLERTVQTTRSLCPNRSTAKAWGAGGLWIHEIKHDGFRIAPVSAFVRRHGSMGPVGRIAPGCGNHNGDIKRAVHGYEPAREAAMGVCEELAPRVRLGPRPAWQ
jgi:hypothetical protein